MQAQDLFAAGPIDSLNAYDRWVARAQTDRGLNDASLAVQRAMWVAFAAWCIRNRIDPVTLTAEELEAFLKSREGTAQASELTARHAWRLVRLIGQVLAFMASEQGLAANGAATELLKRSRRLRMANDNAADPLPEALTDAEDRALTSFLQASVPRSGKNSGLRWQDIRNRAFVALQRGAGMTPLEIRTVRIRDVFVDPDPGKGAWKVRAPATGSVSEHDAPVAKWGRALLEAWRHMRAELEIPGEWLFPATRTGKPLSKTAQFEGCAEVLAAAGLTGPSATGGGYKLRNTFALRQLATKKNTDAEIAAWLGIDEAEMARYHRVLSGPVDVL